MTAAVVEGAAASAGERSADIDWRDLLNQALTMPGRLGNTYCRFYQYSFLNQIWLMCQGVTEPCAPFSMWKALGRSPIKGWRARGTASATDHEGRRGDRREEGRRNAVQGEAVDLPLQQHRGPIRVPVSVSNSQLRWPLDGILATKLGHSGSSGHPPGVPDISRTRSKHLSMPPGCVPSSAMSPGQRCRPTSRLSL